MPCLVAPRDYWGLHSAASPASEGEDPGDPEDPEDQCLPSWPPIPQCLSLQCYLTCPTGSSCRGIQRRMGNKALKTGARGMQECIFHYNQS